MIVMSLKNGVIGSPRTFARTSDWLTDSVCGMSGPSDPDSRTQDPEKSGLSCAVAGLTDSDTIANAKHTVMRRDLRRNNRMPNVNRVEHVRHEQGEPIAADMKLFRVVGGGHHLPLLCELMSIDI